MGTRSRRPAVLATIMATLLAGTPGPAVAHPGSLPVGGSHGALDVGSAVLTLPAMGSATGSLGSLGATTEPLPPCPGPAPHVTTFGAAPVPVLGWTENLALDGIGRVWVSRTFENRVDAYDPTGRVVASVPVRAPGGIALGPDGRMHVAAGTGYLPYTSDVVSFDPAAQNPVARVDARLDSRKNGLAVDAHGNRYLTGLDDRTLTRVTAGGVVDHAWGEAAGIGGANGITVVGDTAFVTQSTATHALLHTVPLDRPAESTATVLTGPPVPPRGLDDLAVTDEAVYVTSWTSGEVLRVDRVTGTTCSLVGGIPRATSVLVADGFGGFGEHDLLVTSLHGPVRHVALP